MKLAKLIARSGGWLSLTSLSHSSRWIWPKVNQRDMKSQKKKKSPSPRTKPYSEIDYHDHGAIRQSSSFSIQKFNKHTNFEKWIAIGRPRPDTLSWASIDFWTCQSWIFNMWFDERCTAATPESITARFCIQIFTRFSKRKREFMSR